jgi:hypothetical protein
MVGFALSDLPQWQDKHIVLYKQFHELRRCAARRVPMVKVWIIAAGQV